jgi:rod shape-determining protein MreC
MDLLTWLILTGLALSVYLLSYVGGLTPVNNVIAYLSREPKTNLSLLEQKLTYLWTGLSNLPQLADQNKKLQEEVSSLRGKLAQVEVVFSENEALIRETGIKYDRNYKQIGALVLSYDVDSQVNLTVNKGSVDGVAVGDVAVVENIALGKVIEVTGVSARVQLITSPNSIIPVKTNKINLGLLTGVNGQPRVTKVLQSSQIAVGEKIFTSGLNAEYPPNFYVGEVTEIVVDPRASTKEVVLKSAIDLQKLTMLKILNLEK